MKDDAVVIRGNWNYPTTIWFGSGRVAELPDACRAMAISRPLLVTDPALARHHMIADTVAANDAAGLPTAVFSELRPNPVGKNIADGVAAFKAGGHDGVIAFGGGSALDTGKTIAFMAGQTRPIWDFEDIGDYWKRANADAVAPIIAVPTTAGTGSEVGRAGVIVDEDKRRKVIVFHPRMLPGIVIADPSLTIGLPPHITAATGMDALAHNLEALCAPGYHPMADGIAVEGIRLVKNWLKVAVENGSDLSARANMMAAATMGATAFQKGLGAIHALSHPVGALYDTHHGLTNAVFMPYVLAANRPAIEERLGRLAGYLELGNSTFGSVMEWVLDLRKSIGIPHTLRDLGIGDDRFDEISQMAEYDPSASGNPRPVKAPQLRAILVGAFEGNLS